MAESVGIITSTWRFNLPARYFSKSCFSASIFSGFLLALRAIINFCRLSSPGLVSSCICGSMSDPHATRKNKATPESKAYMEVESRVLEVFISKSCY